MNTEQQPAGTTAENRVRHVVTFAPIEVTRVYPSPYQESGKADTAELKQIVTTKSYYPTKSVSSSLQENIFGTEDFGYEEQEFTSTSIRMAWIDVPKGSTKEQIVARLSQFPEARIMRIISNKPILSDNQVYAIAQPHLDVTMDSIADTQVVRYSETDENEALRGKLILDNSGKPQYKGTFFRTTTVPDEDRRTKEADDFYVSPSIKAELASMTGHGNSTAMNEGLIPDTNQGTN